jgi:hypothetical protein
LGFEGYSASWVYLWDQYGKPTPVLIVEQGAVIGPAFDGSGTVAAGATASGISVHRVDGVDNKAASAQMAGTPWAAAEDRSGAILAVVQSGGAAKGVWFDLAKGTAGAAFDLGAAAHEAVARPLSSGGIAVRLDGHWVATVQPGATQTSAAPAWLRDGSDFALARGGKAYAVTQNGSSAIEFVSTQGSVCGSMTFTGAGNLSVGADGTVIGGTGTGGCTKVFWRPEIVPVQVGAGRPEGASVRATTAATTTAPPASAHGPGRSPVPSSTQTGLSTGSSMEMSDASAAGTFFTPRMKST